MTCSGRLMSEGILLGHVSMVPLWLLWLCRPLSSWAVSFWWKLSGRDLSQGTVCGCPLSGTDEMGFKPWVLDRFELDAASLLDLLSSSAASSLL